MPNQIERFIYLFPRKLEKQTGKQASKQARKQSNDATKRTVIGSFNQTCPIRFWISDLRMPYTNTHRHLELNQGFDYLIFRNTIYTSSCYLIGSLPEHAGHVT